MSTKRPSVTVMSDLIQKYIGSDYDKVLALADNLDAILATSDLTLDVSGLTMPGFPQGTLEELLEAFAATIATNEAAVDTLPEILSSVADNLAAINALILDTAGTADTDLSLMSWMLDESTMASNDATKVPSQQSVRLFVLDSIVNSALYQGGYDAAVAGGFPTEVETGALVLKGYNWDVTDAGTVDFNDGSIAVLVGDRLKAVKDTPINVADWVHITNTVTGASIAAALFAEANTNNFSDAEQLKLVTTLDTSSSVDQSLYIVDPTRSNKNLSVAETQFVFEKSGNADSLFLNRDGIISATQGYVAPKDGTIIGFDIRGNNSPTKVTDLYINGSSVLTAALVAGVYSETDEDIDFSAGDNIQVFIAAAGASLVDTTATVYVKWRI